MSTRIVELKMLLPPPNPIGNYTAQQFDMIRAFQLLAHAEFEAFLEDSACQAVNGAVRGWLADKQPRLALSHLLLHTDFHQLSPRWHAFAEPDRVTQVAQRFVNFAQGSNNGIRERNVLGLLLPTGLRLAKIKPIWLATIDSFGAGRGQTAHTAKTVQTPPDRNSQEQAVDQILFGLKELDRELARLPSRRISARMMSWASEVAVEAARVQAR